MPRIEVRRSRIPWSTNTVAIGDDAASMTSTAMVALRTGTRISPTMGEGSATPRFGATVIAAAAARRASG
jgi:hypothetical protein